MTAAREPVAAAALQYCAAGSAAETLVTLMPLIDRAADEGAKLVCLPEAATFLAASRAALAEEAEPAGESPVLDRLCNTAARHGIELSIGSIFLGPDGRHVNRQILSGRTVESVRNMTRSTCSTPMSAMEKAIGNLAISRLAANGPCRQLRHEYGADHLL